MSDSILIILAISKVPLHLFKKLTGSTELVEPVLTTALLLKWEMFSKDFGSVVEFEDYKAFEVIKVISME